MDVSVEEDGTAGKLDVVDIDSQEKSMSRSLCCAIGVAGAEIRMATCFGGAHSASRVS
jgi:hypothetical protein